MLQAAETSEVSYYSLSCAGTFEALYLLPFTLGMLHCQSKKLPSIAVYLSWPLVHDVPGAVTLNTHHATI